MTERDRFDQWFYASKYAQVAPPSAGTAQIAYDGWQAALASREAEIKALKAERDDALSQAGVTHGVYPELYALRAEITQLREAINKLGGTRLLAAIDAAIDQEKPKC